jgi:membrane protein involved in colicin uptake
MLANVIIKSDAGTSGKMLNNIATVSSKDSNSTLAAQVLSSVAITAADSTTSVNTELKDKVNFFIDTVTKTSEAAATAAEATEAAEEAAATEAAEEAAATKAAEATEAAEEAAATEAAATEAAEEAAATEAAATEAAEEAVTYNAQGFSNSSPFKHKNGTSFNSDGRDYQGYNEAGYNSEGYSSSTPPIYNPDYDVSPA